MDGYPFFRNGEVSGPAEMPGRFYFWAILGGMCGRFALYSRPPAVSERIGLPEPEQAWTPRYNASPGTWITAAYRPEIADELQLGQLWWGYRPAWAKAGAPQPINARVESVATSRYFQAAFKRHRCLIPANGWYEWLPTGHGKQPYFLCREDRELLLMAGIWAEYADGSACCAILTEPARGRAKDIHDRMPLIMDDASIEPWLAPGLIECDSIRGAVHHLAPELITHWPVSPRVNRPANDDPSLIELLELPGETS